MSTSSVDHSQNQEILRKKILELSHTIARGEDTQAFVKDFRDQFLGREARLIIEQAKDQVMKEIAGEG